MGKNATRKGATDRQVLAVVVEREGLELVSGLLVILPAEVCRRCGNPHQQDENVGRGGREEGGIRCSQYLPDR